MKRNRFHVPLKGPAFLLVSLLAVTLSCELLKLDVFPSYLGSTQGLVQLDSYLRAAGADPSQGDLGFMVFLDGSYQGTSYHYLGVVWHQNPGGPLLLFFDGESLAFRKSLANLPAGAYLGCAADGHLITGGPISSEGFYYIFIQPLTLEEDGPSTAFNVDNNYSRAWVAVAPHSGTPKTYLVSSFSDSGGNKSIMEYFEYSSGSFSGTQKPFSTSSSFFSLVDLLKVGDTLLFLVKNETENTVIPYGASDFTSFNFETAYSSLTAPLPRIPLGNDGRAWISPGGVITVEHRDGARLSRYSLSDGSKLDEFAMPYLKDGIFAFAADGRRWACYDRDRRKLYLLRTWW